MRRPSSSPLFLAAVAALALHGCQDAARPLSPTATMSAASAEPAPLVPRIIAPQTTDPNIDWIPPFNPSIPPAIQSNNHYVWLDPSRESNGKLFVFMPGTGGFPRGNQLVQQEAARLGYHVIGLMYQNNVGAGRCTGSPDPDCSRNMDLEIIDGVARSGIVDVSPANSIDNRLAKLLRYLDAQYPNERWSGFLKNGAPRWSRITVSGHSQGAGHAVLIGKIRRVHRVVMFSGPVFARVPGEPDAWVVSSGLTPAAKYFALMHQRDHFAAGLLPNIRALNLEDFGDPVAPELSEPPYGGTHILITDLEPTGGYATPNPHRSTAPDAWTPLGPDGTPLLRDAWRYLLGGWQLDEDDDHDDDDDEDDDRRSGNLGSQP